MIKYYAYFGTIKPVEVERVTDNSVWVRGRRSNREGTYDGYFDSWEEARQFLLKKAQVKLDSARRHLEAAQSEYGNIKGLKE